MRKSYIDNLRNLTILLLFPVHTFMIWNDFGSGFYIWQGESRIFSTLIVLVNPCFMPILFVLAGMSAHYALEKRAVKQFVKQRFNKLFIPFIGGVLFLVPIQTYYARRASGGYNGSFFDNWKYFFTHLTDFSGYDGAFTPGHLWFILFLFLISLIALLPFHFLPYEKIRNRIEQIPVLGILMLFIPVWLMYYLGNFGGFSIGKNLALYLIGYYVLYNDAVLEKLEKNIVWLAGLCMIGTIVLVVCYYRFAYYGDLWINYIGWNTILVWIVCGRKYLNRKTRRTEYFNQASYPIYILHQSILVMLAYYVVRICPYRILQALLICMGSFIGTILAYYLVKWVPVVRKVVGVK